MSDPHPWSADLQLVQDTLAGDADAVNLLLRRMVCIPRFLKSLAAQRTGPLVGERLDEASQETFLRVWRDRATFTGNARLETWVYGYARNVYLESSRERILEGQRRESFEETEPEVAVEGDVEERLARLQEADLIREELARLGPDSAAVVRSRLLDDESFADIETRTGEHRSALKARYYRAIKRIAARMEGRHEPAAPQPRGNDLAPEPAGREDR